MNGSRYYVEVIDINGSSKTMVQMVACDPTTVLDKLTEISASIAHPGYRIRVKDKNGDTVFVGLMTRQGAENRDDRVA